MKQHFDVFGPWKPIQYISETPLGILRQFAFKSTYWEMTCALKADWVIVRSSVTGIFRSYVESFPRLVQLLKEQDRLACDEGEVDFCQYDIVVSLEPFISPDIIAKARNTTFFYFMNEHNNEEYNKQKTNPAPAYAAFLDHMCGSTGAANVNSRTIEFPYLRAPDVVRACFPPKERDKRSDPTIWLDARTVIRAATSERRGTWTEACDRFLEELRGDYGLNIISRGLLYKDFYNLRPLGVNDAIEYYTEIRQADFFIGSNAAGAGQSLCDAASLGLACYGSRELVYHRMICDEDRLCERIDVALQKAVDIWKYPDRIAATIAEQDNCLHVAMYAEPIRKLLQMR